MRKFSSKGAFLVVFWMALLSGTGLSFLNLYYALFKGLQDLQLYYYFALTPAVPFIICAPLIGWFADTRFGNYKVFKAGALLTLLATVVACVCVLILENVSKHSTLALVLSGGISVIAYILAFIGIIACALTTVQLGLDQMPDASPANITSFIAWMIFSVGVGCWITDFLYLMLVYCIKDKRLDYQVFSLFQVCCMSIVCNSLFLFGKKWLIIEPKSSQSLKTIYQVLKFAAKHKAPLNRSALTYWEENIPSRLDLGKSRYGGPFTTEQVEDVKTFFKILIVLLPVFVSILLSTNVDQAYKPVNIPGLTHCTSQLIYPFTFSPFFWIMVMTCCNEFVVYPLFRNKLPSILTSIGIGNIFVLLVQVGYLIVSVVEYVHPLGGILWQWPYIVSCVMFGCITQFMLTKLLEFVCAQSPYHMRGLLTGYVVFVYLSALAAGNLLERNVVCPKSLSYCSVIRHATVTAVGLIGFIIYCLLARWYKMRVRDEAYNAHQVVEEIYDRYLSYRYMS